MNRIGFLAKKGQGCMIREQPQRNWVEVIEQLTDENFAFLPRNLVSQELQIEIH